MGILAGFPAIAGKRAHVAGMIFPRVIGLEPYSANGLGGPVRRHHLAKTRRTACQNPGPPGSKGDTCTPGRPGPAPSVSLIFGDFEKSGLTHTGQRDVFPLHRLQNRLPLQRSNHRTVESVGARGTGARWWKITVNKAVCGVICVKFEK